eukprot:Gb_11311 [translate_table: standard]
MEDFGGTDLSMDLNLNLSPPSPAPHLGLALGLESSAPSADYIGRSHLPDIIWPRFQPLNPYTGLQDPDTVFIPSIPSNQFPEHGPSENTTSGNRPSEQVQPPPSSPARYRSRRRRIRSILADSAHSRPPHFMFRALDRPQSPSVCPETPAVPPKESLQAEENLTVEKSVEINHGANFECNICLEMASEPVVTSCGHLFCWPCLYQWLHVHSNSKECPVCKGEVSEKNITPIYGRGVLPSSNPNINSNSGPDEDVRREIPPRPHAHRLESSRPRERPGHMSFARRVDEILRMRSIHRRARDVNNENGTSGQEEGVHDLLGAATNQIFNRLRTAQRLQIENSAESRRLRDRILAMTSWARSSGGIEPLHIHIDEVEEAVPVRLEGEEVLGDLAFPRSQRAARLAAIRARLASMEGMLQTLANANPRPVTSAHFHPPPIVFPPHYPTAQVAGRHRTHQAREPVLSTNVVIQPDFRTGEAVAEEDSFRSSRSQRRREAHTSGASGSSDVDGGLVHVRKIRRLH